MAAVSTRPAPRTAVARQRGVKRLLVPIDTSLRGVNALGYAVEHLADEATSVHLVNVQKPILSGNVTPLVTGEMVAATRRAAGERALALARAAYEDSGVPITSEVAFGDPAPTICGVAQARGCTGIVIARNGFELHDLIGGSVAAGILRLATVPVTMINAAALAAQRQDDRNAATGDSQRLMERDDGSSHEGRTPALE